MTATTLLRTQKARHSPQTTRLPPTPPIYKPITLPLYYVHILLPILRPPLYIDCLETHPFRSPQIISMRRHHHTFLPLQLPTSHQLHRFFVNPPIRLRQPQQLTREQHVKLQPATPHEIQLQFRRPVREHKNLVLCPQPLQRHGHVRPGGHAVPCIHGRQLLSLAPRSINIAVGVGISVEQLIQDPPVRDVDILLFLASLEPRVDLVEEPLPPAECELGPRTRLPASRSYIRFWKECVCCRESLDDG